MTPIQFLIAAVVAASFCTAAVADDVLFENVRIFDGRSATLSAPSNVLVKGNLIDTVSGSADRGRGSDPHRRQAAAP